MFCLCFLSAMMKKAVILLSGGLDSATVAAMAKAQGYELYALSFSYGQRHSVELEAAARVAQQAGAKEHKIAQLDLRLFGHSALTDDIAVPKDRDEAEMTTIPVTYVPARNTIFLSYALAYAEVLESADIFCGVNAVDYSGYPDCRPEYIAAYQAMARLATAYSVGEGALPVTIHAPLIDLSKADIIRRGTELGVDYSLTVSCYDPDETGAACGRCDSCTLRRNGFNRAGIDDVTRYQKG
jgi:7-cyano-7-deazaguanine synthase